MTVPPPALGGGLGRERQGPRGSFDVVLGADVTYNPANADALANALVAHASPSTKILLAHEGSPPTTLP